MKTVTQTSLVPFFATKIQAGFPSPATGYIEKALDLNEFCIKHPNATYLLRVVGDSMIEAGIFEGDILIVDRSYSAKHGDIVIASYNGEFTVKKLDKKQQIRLIPMNKDYKPIVIKEEDEFEIFGVVIHSIRSFQ